MTGRLIGAAGCGGVVGAPISLAAPGRGPTSLIDASSTAGGGGARPTPSAHTSAKPRQPDATNPIITGRFEFRGGTTSCCRDGRSGADMGGFPRAARFRELGN
jgi:hypothetical protein